MFESEELFNIFNPAQFDIRPRPERILNFSDRVRVLHQRADIHLFQK